MAILIDTSVLFAYLSFKDSNHSRAESFIDQLPESVVAIVITPVLHELFHIVTARTNYNQAMQAFVDMSTAFRVLPLTSDDFPRMQAIMRRYEDNRFDFVDVAIMAVAERLGITEVATFDRRDFSVYRPSPTGFFTLLP
jgi:hypothetical protein